MKSKARKITKSIRYLLLCGVLMLAATVGGGGCSKEKHDPYAELPPTKNTTNFQSLSMTEFENINGKTVTVDLFTRRPEESLNNPNVGQAILIYQCIRYKQAHPDERVYLTFTSFHVSVVAAACLDTESAMYGYMKSLYDSEYDGDGFVRISYLLVCAAKLGIDTTVVGQLDASAVDYESGYREDYPFDEYFNSHMNDEAVGGKTVGDYMTFRKAAWTSYGDKSASDMMHVKSCSVSNYIDNDGVEHGGSVWLGSINLDGIKSTASNGNDGVQTGVIISDHEMIRTCVYNYVRLMSEYCGQEEISIFRDKVVGMNTAQINAINAGSPIADDQRIVYLGSESDNVFEIYFTPLGGSAGTWDTVYNPYSKYISKLLPSVSGGGSITFAWNNVKYLTNFEFSKILTNVLVTAFTENPRLTNKLYLRLPGIDESAFSKLSAGQNIGVKRINKDLDINYHSKDFQLSYLEKTERKYVTVLNSLNFHQGAMSYQTNTIFVIKETRKTNNNVYVTFGALTTNGVIDENDRISAPITASKS